MQGGSSGKSHAAACSARFVDAAIVIPSPRGERYHMPNPNKSLFHYQDPLDPLTCQSTESIRPLKVCCGIWHQDVSSRSFKSCKLQGGASVDLTFLSSTSHRCLIGLRSGEFGGQVNISNSLVCSSNHSWTILALLHSVLSSWKRPQPSGNTISMKGCTWSAIMLRYVICVKVTSTWMVGPKISHHSIAQSITLPPLDCLLSIVHPDAMCSPGKRHTRTQPSRLCKRKRVSSDQATVFHRYGGEQGSAWVSWLIYCYAARYTTNCDALCVLTPFYQNQH